MAAANINRVILTGNLTRDPDLRATPSGVSVCRMRLASNTRRKAANGAWEDKPNYFDVVTFGGQAEACAKHLRKGGAVAIDGRLEWSEYTDRAGGRRQAVQIIAEHVQFLGGPRDPQPPAAAPVADAEAEPDAALVGDDDIPF